MKKKQEKHRTIIPKATKKKNISQYLWDEQVFDVEIPQKKKGQVFMNAACWSMLQECKNANTNVQNLPAIVQ